MTTLPVYDIQNQKVKDIELDDQIFDSEIRPSQFYDVVRMELASQRKGPWYEEGGQNLGDKKEPEELGLDRDDLPSGREEEPSSAPCQKTIPFLFPKRLKERSSERPSV
jgi:hypothetical protein